MKDGDKDKVQPLKESIDLRKKIVELEEIENFPKSTEKQFKKSEQLYNLIFKNSSDIIGITTFSLNPVYIYINPSIKSIGYKQEELLGKSPFDFIHPDDRKKLFLLLKKYINNKEKKRFIGKESTITERIAYRFKDKDGNWRNFQTTGSIVENQLLFTTRDVTKNKKMEEELRENQRTLLTLMNNLPGMSYRCRNDRDWTMELVSEGCLDLTGYKPEEIINNKVTSFGQLIHKHDQNYVWNEVQASLKAKKRYKVVYRIKTAEGKEKWVWEQAQGVFAANGKLLQIEGFITDITERKLAEETLRKSQQEFVSLFKSSPEALVYTDEKSNILDVNPRFTELFGYILEEIKGRSIDDGMITPPDKMKEAKKLTSKTLKEDFYFETTRKKKNGTLFPVAISGSRVMIDGRFKGFIASYRDIAYRQKMMDDLKNSEEEYRSLFENMPGAYYRTNREGNFIMINPEGAKVFGYNSSEDILGKNTTQHFYFAPEERKSYLKELKKNKGNLKDFELTLKKKDGTPLVISDTSHYNYNKEGNISGIEGIFIDITERKKAEEKLRQSEEKFAGIFKNIPDAAFYQDTKGIILDVNPHFTRIFSYTKEEILGKNIDEIGFYPKDKLKEGEDLTRKTLNEDLANFETIRQKKDGTLVPVRISTSLVKIKDKVAGIIALYQDITERKQNEITQKVLYNISKAANSPISLKQLYKNIHKELGTIIDTANFYIALVDEKEDKVYFPYHVDEKDDDFPILNFSTSNTLTTYVIKTGEPLLSDNSQYKEMINQGILSLKGSTTLQSIWLGVPLKIEDHVIGAMAVQSYTNPKLYTEGDIKLFEFVSSQIATAIERKRTEEKIKHLSFHDVLTGLYNRAYFEEELERYNFSRYYPLSIVMLDVNGLKVINDTFGHQEGDRLLQHLSESLTSVSRQGDILARIGGDEFAILLPSTTSEQAHEFCERVKKVCQQDKIKPIYLRLNISLGHTTQEGEYKDMYSFLKTADLNMYHDKLFNGKSREKHFLEAFRIVLKERDPHTSDHAERLQELALSLGERIGLSEYQLGDLKLLALLHDIGKIGIPDSILFKTYILTPSEWKKMEEHSDIGYRMAKNIPDFAPIAQDILHHHERWDGTGYPNGLKGENIPLLSRIISIVVAYDVMQSRRPYKGSISKAEALKEIKRCAGTQFDPQLVEIFLKIVQNNKSKT